MRKITSTLLFFISFFTFSEAQTPMHLLGMTYLGGDSGGGVLFDYNSGTLKDSIIKSLVYPGGGEQFQAGQGVIQASDGNLYGLVSSADVNGSGAIFRYTPATGAYKIIAKFNGVNGERPVGNLIQASDGNLYGATFIGGTSNNGTLFKCSLAGSLTTLVYFNGTNGASPPGGPIQAADGNLYGMTYDEGPSNGGTIYKCTTSGTLTTIVSFSGPNGKYPAGGNLIQGSDGNLYGMTTRGGTSDSGVVFQCSTSGTINVLSNLNYLTGNYPYGSLLQAFDGNLYGLTTQGGTVNSGTLFKCTTSGTLTVLVDFNDTANGYDPVGSLVQASDSNLYGTTTANNIFKCTTSGMLTNIFYFNNYNGNYPDGALLQAKDGNLYGITDDGGSNEHGTFYKCTTTGSFTELHDFNATIIGDKPWGNLILASDGNYYGTTSYGGAFGYGTILKYTPVGKVSTLYNFSDTNQYPQGSLIQASDGNLYGMTAHGGGGMLEDGTIFKCTLSGQLTTLDTIGSYQGSLIQAIDGNLYGMMLNGGKNADGYVFKYDTGTHTLSDFADFNGSNGHYPYGSLIQAKDSNFYGLTYGGGKFGDGNIFKCTMAGVITDLADFAGGNGQFPRGDLLQGLDGNFYGMTQSGGSSGSGTIFKCTQSGLLTNLVSFSGISNGASPQGNLIQSSDSTLYGMAQLGGANDTGTIFKCTPSGKLTTLVNLQNKVTGSAPQGSLLQTLNSTIVKSSNCSGQILTTVVEGGKRPYNYKWSTGATASSINGL